MPKGKRPVPQEKPVKGTEKSRKQNNARKEAKKGGNKRNEQRDNESYAKNEKGPETIDISKYLSPNSNEKTEIYDLGHKDLTSIDEIMSEVLSEKRNLSTSSIKSSEPVAIRILAPDNEISLLPALSNVKEPGKNIDGTEDAEGTRKNIRVITYIDVSSNLLTSTSLRSLENIGDTLRFLNISGNKISSLVHISKLTNLMCLILTNNNIQDISPITELVNLNTLLLGQNKISSIPIKVFQKMRLLRKLVLSHNNLTEVPDLTGCTALNEFRLAHNNIQMLPMSLVANSDISVLDVSQNKIETMGALSVLSSLSHLRNLFITDNPVFTSYISSSNSKSSSTNSTTTTTNNNSNLSDNSIEKTTSSSTSRQPGSELFYAAIIKLNDRIMNINGVSTSSLGGGKKPERQQTPKEMKPTPKKRVFKPSKNTGEQEEQLKPQRKRKPPMKTEVKKVGNKK